MKKYIMALDLGTTSNRCILFDKEGEIISLAQKEFTQYFPKPGWVEHDASEIYSALLDVCHLALERAGADVAEIDSIGITNQRETAVVWNRESGKPVCPAIVWQCRRTADMCERLVKDGYTEIISEKTGLVPDPYFSATKIKYILDSIPGAKNDAKAGKLLFGTVDSYVIWMLSGGKYHITDVTNASRTMLFNINTLQYDEELLKLFTVPECMLPTVVPSTGVFAYTDATVFGKALPIGGIAGDQQAALFGQGCFEKGETKNTYGTGCFLLMNTADERKYSKNGLITTLACSDSNKPVYALEGSVFVAGAAVQWLRDEMKLIATTSESETAANSVPDSNGCYVIPAFTGLGAPYWDKEARGGIFGLTRGVNRNHIIRATLESLAYQTLDVIKAMESDSGIYLKSLKVDGGASRNNFLMQFQADIAGSPVCRPDCIETTAFGAASLAGLATGFWSSKEEIQSKRKISRIYNPSITAGKREDLYNGWLDAVRRIRTQ